LTNDEILDYYNVESIRELEKHIAYIKEILKREIENYQEELEKIDHCFCLDSHGEFKYLYRTQQEAEKQREHTLKTKKIKLTLYSCPYHCGWHLSRI